MRQPPLLNKPLQEQSPEEFKTLVQSFYERPEGSTPVSGVKIIFGKKVTQIRFDKDKEKKVSRKDIKTLAEFYERTEEELLELFSQKNRKIKIV